ncbi:MAG: hypothetical protein HY673_20625, partial [Chloroflexi bacterium]|nr:hypothetical protein [Chloroflexota bacterium]
VAGKPRFGQAIDPQAIRVTLAELVAHPETYEGKNVVVEGEFAGRCGDGDFFFKDQFELIEADPPQPEVCKLKKGTKIRLYGLVKVHRTSEPDEKGEAAEKLEAGEKKGQAYVKIVGKGVEVR